MIPFDTEFPAALTIAAIACFITGAAILVGLMWWLLDS